MEQGEVHKRMMAIPWGGGPHTLSEPKEGQGQSQAMARETPCLAAPGNTAALLSQAHHKCQRNRNLSSGHFPQEQPENYCLGTQYPQGRTAGL